MEVQDRSTTFEGWVGAEGNGAASPSGRNPMSSGRFRNKILMGAKTIRISKPNIQHALRQPVPRINHCTQGSNVTEPSPTPENARPIARPRVRTNQFGKNSDWPE